MESRHTTSHPEHVDRESSCILALLALAGLVPVSVALAHGLGFRGGEGVGLVLIALALWGWLGERIGRRPPG